MRVRFLQHVPFEGPAGIEEVLRGTGHELAVSRLFAGDPLPDPEALDWLVVLGGPMSVHDEARHPWLVPEKALVRRCIDAGRRVLGVCLGAQLVAEVLGGRVVPAASREIGWFPVERTEEAVRGALGQVLPPRFPAFHWHGEAFELPPGALHLARSEACAQQAFSWGEQVLALQFHVETTPAAARALVEHGAGDLVPGRFVQEPAAILAADAPFPRLRPVLAALLDALARA